jgi:hypothetical protein
MPPLIKGVLIGFFGSASQFSVDKYKLDPALALMFNLLVVVWSCGEPPSCFTALDCLALDFSNRRARERLGVKAELARRREFLPLTDRQDGGVRL